jgi:hypothetical protein
MLRDFFRSRNSRSKKKITAKRILRGEILEPRTMLSATVLSGEMQQATSAVNPATYAVTAAAPVNHAPTVARAAAAASNPVTGKTVQLSVLGADDAGEGNLKYTWTATSIPNGAWPPFFSINGINAAKNSTVTFYKAGTYVFTATIADAGKLTVSSSVTVVVNQTFTSIFIYPGNQVIYPNLKLQLNAMAFDQFSYPMAVQPAFNWSCSGGGITNSGLFIAAAPPGNITVTASSGTIHGSTIVTIANSTNFLDLYDATLANLTQSLFVDGSIDRQDMIDILQSVCPASNGALGQVDFNDLKTIMLYASGLNMPGYVQALAGDVINGSFANAWYQGQRLGNLTYLTTGANYTKLIDKWFYGSDHPVIDANIPTGQTYSYTTVSGSLFNTARGIPSHANEFQGRLGDCYFITALGSVADTSPAAIQNMFHDNNDGTWTVRFYSGSVANYVTVDRKLPTASSGALVYSDFGMMNYDTTNTLWIALAEKAYAQFSEIIQGGGYGTNCYSAIEGGIPGTVYNNVLGYAPNYYDMSNQQAMINAINSHLAVGICTNATTDSNSGLHPGHAYAVIGYDNTMGTFTLYNPWGFGQPGPLTWTDLQNNCWGFQTADPSGTISFGAIPQLGSLPRTLAITQVIITNTSQNHLAYSPERDTFLNPRQEPGSTSNKGLKLRDRLFAFHSTDGFNIPAFDAAWMAIVRTRQSSATPRDLQFLAADEFFGETMSLELDSNSPAPLWERIC